MKMVKQTIKRRQEGNNKDDAYDLNRNDKGGIGMQGNRRRRHFCNAAGRKCQNRSDERDSCQLGNDHGAQKHSRD